MAAIVRALGAPIVCCSLLLASCTTAPELPSHKSALGFPVVTGLGQVVDARSKVPVFMPCDPCQVAPTPKTAMAASEPLDQPAVTPPPLAPPAAAMRSPGPAPSIPPAPTVKGAVFFATGSTRLSRPAWRTLHQLVVAGAGASTVVLQGQADSSGSASLNTAIASARADAVAGALRHLGIPADKIVTTGCATCYAASNETADGRRLNRRVEVAMTPKGRG